MATAISFQTEKKTMEEKNKANINEMNESLFHCLTFVFSDGAFFVLLFFFGIPTILINILPNRKQKV